LGSIQQKEIVSIRQVNDVYDLFHFKMDNLSVDLQLIRVCRYQLGVTSLAFDHSGTTLAIATSYNYERGENFDTKSAKDKIYIRRVTENETKPKMA
jgi:hypothetical protein